MFVAKGEQREADTLLKLMDRQVHQTAEEIIRVKAYVLQL